MALWPSQKERYGVIGDPSRPPLNNSECCRLFDEFCPGGYYRNFHSEAGLKQSSVALTCAEMSSQYLPLSFLKNAKLEGKLGYKSPQWSGNDQQLSFIYFNVSISNLLGQDSIRVVDRELVVASSSVLALTVQTWGVDSRVIWKHNSQYIF